MHKIPFSNILYVCLTHIPLEINFPEYVTPLYMGNSQKNGLLNLSDISNEWHINHSVLGSTAGAFALNKILSNDAKEITHIGICQYRKFLTTERIGTQAENYQVMDLVTLELLSKTNLNEIMIPHNENFLISQPGQFLQNNINRNYLYQYKDTHFIEDILRFTAIAVEVGAIDKEEVLNFFNEVIFYPGGIELGVFPKIFWLQHMILLEKITRECIKTYPNVRVGSQARIWAFCCERLGSYFLIRELRSQSKNNINFIHDCTGQLNLLVKDISENYIPGE